MQDYTHTYKALVIQARYFNHILRHYNRQKPTDVRTEIGITSMQEATKVGNIQVRLGAADLAKYRRPNLDMEDGG